MILAGSSLLLLQRTTANNLIAAYKQMIVKAHSKNIRIYGGTIMPFQVVMVTIINTVNYAGIPLINGFVPRAIMMGALISIRRCEIHRIRRDFVSTYQNDGLHPDAAGYKTMGESIDLNLFIEALSTGMNERSGNLPELFCSGKIIRIHLIPRQLFPSVSHHDHSRHSKYLKR